MNASTQVDGGGSCWFNSSSTTTRRRPGVTVVVKQEVKQEDYDECGGEEDDDEEEEDSDELQVVMTYKVEEEGGSRENSILGAGDEVALEEAAEEEEEEEDGCGGESSCSEPDCLASSSSVSGDTTKHTASTPPATSCVPEDIVRPQGRRIYPTLFKLKVLDSYRQDDDCRGNQRATARKFGIHRRQIQKWLQVEQDLRQSVIVSPQQQQQPATTVSVVKMIEEEEPIALNLCIKSQSNNNDLVDEVIDVVTGDEDPQDLSGYCSRLQDQQTPSPSTSSVSGKRRSFTLQFKLDVLDAFYSNAACKGNQRATARLFGINRRQVQKWLCQEAQLRSEAALTYPGESESSAKRQRLGRWLWTVPHWTMVHYEDTPSHPAAVMIPHLSPPQDTALCLKVEKTSSSPSIPEERPRSLTPPSCVPPLAHHQGARLMHPVTTQIPLQQQQPPRPPPPPAPTEQVPPPVKPKRHSYPLVFKLQALDAYHEDLSCRGNQRAVAKRFSIHRRQVQKWLKQEPQLRQRLAMGTKETPAKTSSNTTVVQQTIRSPAILKPVQMLTSQQSAYSWVEELRTPTAPCWS